MAHPGKMLPAIAEHAIMHYTQPDDLVIDPMCGIGTTLVEAVRQDAPGYAAVVQGDARDIVRLAGSDFGRQGGARPHLAAVRGLPARARPFHPPSDP